MRRAQLLSHETNNEAEKTLEISAEPEEEDLLYGIEDIYWVMMGGMLLLTIIFGIGLKMRIKKARRDQIDRIQAEIGTTDPTKDK